jgi:hypothetical protein
VKGEETMLGAGNFGTKNFLRGKTLDFAGGFTDFACFLMVKSW